MTDPVQQRSLALEAANKVRGDRERLRRAMSDGTTDWRAVILYPPACVDGLLLTELLMLLPWMSRARIEALSLAAFHEGITLSVRAGRACNTTRVWLVKNTLPHGRSNRGRRALPLHGGLRPRRRTGVA